MFVAVRDVMLHHVPVEPFASLARLETSSVDIVVERDMTTPRFLGRDGGPFDLSDRPGRAELSNRLSEHGMTVCCLSLGTDFSREDLDGEAEWMATACEVARELEAPVIRIDPAVHARRLEEDELIDRAAEAIAATLEASEETDLAAENHGKTANRPDFLRALIDRVGSERFGLTLDVGNFYWSGQPLSAVYRIAERFAPYAKHTHVKNIAYPEEKREQRRETGWEYGTYVSPIPEGDVDQRRIVGLLREASYDRALTVEDESLGQVDPEAVINVLMSDVEYLQSILR